MKDSILPVWCLNHISSLEDKDIAWTEDTAACDLVIYYHPDFLVTLVSSLDTLEQQEVWIEKVDEQEHHQREHHRRAILQERQTSAVV